MQRNNAVAGSITDIQTLREEYEMELAALRSENELLRRSAQAFGELAERLNRMVNDLSGDQVLSAKPDRRNRCISVIVERRSP